MNITALGCAGSLAAGHDTTAFLLDDDVLLDAGSGVGTLGIEALLRIDHVLLSHSHIDHILGLPLLADTVLRQRTLAGRPPIQVHALEPTLAALRRHLFNGVLWPDFTRLPSAEHPVLSLHPCHIGQVLAFGARRIEVLPARHTVPACGFAVQGPAGRWWAYSGDTGPNPALWHRLRQLPLSHLVVECAFDDDEFELADRALHLCPRQLRTELQDWLPLELPLYITHIKPGIEPKVMGALSAQLHPLVPRALHGGQVFQLD
ncbi:MBL fold metallo-hydrolase [Roseateles sp. BYS180W]|uniref:MBL fold metallo-hydrolase n=1 Tax=Roseateles rivi TaxID=3299028 RepID=A0ABW7FT66_9BURK